MEDTLISKTAKVSKDAVLVGPIRIYDAVTISSKTQIGKYTYLGSNTHVGSGVTIGNYCCIARNTDISPVNHPTDHLSCHPFQFNTSHFSSVEGYSIHQRIKAPTPSPSIIGHDVRLGAGALIHQGVTVGIGAIVEDRAVVIKDVPPYAIVRGIPAEVIGYRFDEAIIDRLLASQWWELDPKDMTDIDFQNISEALDKINTTKLHMGLQNRNALSGTITNAASGTNSGIVWFSTPTAYADMNALDRFTSIEVLSHEAGPGDASPLVAPGFYPIHSTSFDAKRGWYRLTFVIEGEPYKGKLFKKKFTFKLGTARARENS